MVIFFIKLRLKNHSRCQESMVQFVAERQRPGWRARSVPANNVLGFALDPEVGRIIRQVQ